MFPVFSNVLKVKSDIDETLGYGSIILNCLNRKTKNVIELLKYRIIDNINA